MNNSTKWSKNIFRRKVSTSTEVKDEYSTDINYDIDKDAIFVKVDFAEQLKMDICKRLNRMMKGCSVSLQNTNNTFNIRERKIYDRLLQNKEKY